MAFLGEASGSAPAEKPSETSTARVHGYTYFHDSKPEIPWSMHIFKFRRDRPELEFTTTLGGGDVFGMSDVARQMQHWTNEPGRAIAAINGDFYNDRDTLGGDPRDLQIRHGELVSAPAGHSCFWIDPEGQPHCTNVVSKFQLTWPGGARTAFGLNEARRADMPVLYTPVCGTTGPAGEERDLVLEPVSPTGPGGGWPPLQADHAYRTRVREIRKASTAAPAPGTMILSVNAATDDMPPKVSVGDIIEFSTAVFPSMAGVTMAIGGGPALLRNGEAMTWPGIRMRHPRSALGWNKDHYFLVEVDGRQNSISVGMTFPELAAYMAELGCTDAINFDGGGSATLWVMGNVMNSPSEGRARPGANALVVVQRPKGAR
jgi:Phosphodiester glycosidase